VNEVTAGPAARIATTLPAKESAAHPRMSMAATGIVRRRMGYRSYRQPAAATDN
jgi:hypothetical protein